TTFERLAHQLLAVAFVVLPGVVHESHARVNRLVHDAQGLALRLRHPQVVAAERERRDLDARAPQKPSRNFARIFLAHSPPPCSPPHARQAETLNTNCRREKFCRSMTQS